MFKTGNLNVVTAYSYFNRIKNTYIRNLVNLKKVLYVGFDNQDTSWFNNFLIRPVFSNNLSNSILKYQLGFDLNRESGGGKRVENNRQEIGDYAAFLSLAYMPLPQLSIQPGIRAIYNTKYTAPIVYSLNVKWNIMEDLIIRASVAKGFRAPSIKELYLFFVDTNHEITGNPNLGAETSDNFSMDVSYNTQTAAVYNWGLEFGLFYNHMKNKIQLVKIVGSKLAYSYVNVDQYYTQGFDVNFNNRVYPWLKVVLGYGVTGRKMFNNDMLKDNGFYYSSDVTVQSNITWRKPALEFSVFYKYSGSYPDLVFDNFKQLQITTAEAYNTLDINVSRWFFKRSLNVQVGGKNLFNVTNLSSSGYMGGGDGHTGSSNNAPMEWGRTLFVKLQYNISK
jgi:outer membrane receptor for ferrienterochelin and colicins